MKTQQINCYNCSSSEIQLYDTENGFNLVKCKNCGLLYVNPQPDRSEIEKAHEIGQHRGEKTIDVTGNFSSQKVETYLKIIKDFYGEKCQEFSGKKWLDIGCGHGEFIKAIEIFSEGTCNIQGIEPNVYKQKSAQNQGLNVSFFDLDKCETKYDFISLLNVYSHLPNPIESLTNWSNLLTEEGELLIQTGDSADLNSQDHHKPYYLPDHLSFVSEKILTDILKKIGFNIFQIKKYRFSEFPVPSLTSVTKETLKLIVPHKKSSLFTELFPKHPNRDMWIRATKKIEVL
ncbi:class I SAM-dependent methyltransferase [Cyanothece sp. BG0011]|uniref:class I SAM-dependent methyltransferase n=1 Tax=Cyanothece sp. BG0011 TaxID=2082950 RepID=UPI0013003C4C|nr:class I SAM-dependent methyltransferase [Cyanothece sp. BG0011]